MTEAPGLRRNDCPASPEYAKDHETRVHIPKPDSEAKKMFKFLHHTPGADEESQVSVERAYWLQSDMRWMTLGQLGCCFHTLEAMRQRGANWP